LATLNSWRKLKGLAPAANLEDAMKAAKAQTSDADPDSNGLAPDVLLDESAAIALDIGAQGLFRSTSAFAEVPRPQ
jgi:hypothetical protein